MTHPPVTLIVFGLAMSALGVLCLGLQIPEVSLVGGLLALVFMLGGLGSLLLRRRGRITLTKCAPSAPAGPG